jgi:small-conductance mechanosensitive channel
VISITVIIIGILVSLTTLPAIRTFGATVLASAGILGIIAGIAGQSTLGNMIAGIQIAFSGALRIGDVVVVQAQWGTIETITLT